MSGRIERPFLVGRWSELQKLSGQIGRALGHKKDELEATRGRLRRNLGKESDKRIAEVSNWFATKGFRFRPLVVHEASEAATVIWSRMVMLTEALERGIAARPFGFDRAPAGSDLAHNHELLAICRLLADAVGCSTWTLYGWDQRRNQPVLLGTAGLRYPETEVGSFWKNGIVREHLLDERPGVAQLAGTEESSFRAREGIERTWVVRIAAKLRAALFLNWRHNGADHSAVTRACRICTDVPAYQKPRNSTWFDDIFDLSDKTQPPRRAPDEDHAEQATDPGPDLDQPEAEPRESQPEDLELALRHCTDWLAAQRVRVAGPATPKPRVTSFELLVKDLAQAFDPWLPYKGSSPRSEPIDASVLISTNHAFRKLFDEERGHDARVYVCEDDGAVTADEESPNPQTRTLRLDGSFVDPVSGEVVASEHDECLRVRLDGPIGPPSPAISLLAQSMIWRSPILIRDLAPLPAPLEAADATLLRTRLEREGSKPRGSESAVPIPGRTGPLGGITIETEHKGAISRGHLRWIEVGATLTGALYDFCSSASEEARRWLGELLFGRHSAKNFADIERSATHYLCEHLGADIAYLVLYDNDLQALLASGVSLSKRLEPVVYTKLLGDPPPNGDDPLRRQLLGMVAASRLRPNRRGESWKVYRGKIPTGEHRAGRPFVGDPAIDRRIHGIGLPVSSRHHAAPDGVLWLGFLDSDRRLDPDLIHAVRPVTRVLAALYAVHRSWESATGESTTQSDPLDAADEDSEKAASS